MSEYDHRFKGMFRAVERLEDGVEVVGGGEREDEDNLETAAEEVVPTMVEEP